MDKIVNLAKRRGFIFPSADIYGGLGGFWDSGPLGVLLKNNVKAQWWKTFVQQRDDVVGIDGSIVTNPRVWEASGHLKGFADKLVECTKCHRRFKADDVADKCPECGGAFMEARQFNLMFKTFVGPVDGDGSTAFLRPETAQSIFVNYENVRDTMRNKLPFGIAQIGKAFRNEITPGNFIFRSREFEQMEIEYFVIPGQDEAAFTEWVESCYQWFINLGIKPEHVRKFEQPKAELAHYSTATTDIEFAFPIEKGWAELMGIANRTDYDLKQHGKLSRNDEEAFATPVDPEGKVKKVPYVIEPSMGVDRAALAFLLDAYTVVEGGRSTTTESIKEEEMVLKLHPALAPYKLAVLPLSKKPELQSVAHEIAKTLRQEWMVSYDETASIGKRYRRQDEIGTPWCVTVDFDTIEGTKRPKGTVTIRDRDTMQQDVVAIAELPGYFRAKMA
ncbi:MAG: glycine--tRNA ligase [Candidatus Kerfeldbacteria bacterium]|nr:glycine--tRNA ligase [Candidatus Kerfeldbacteria bacterium]